jgi:glycosyltransferase involved in cell wall biosynthesis
MRILLATDAWRPQVNGVVRTLENMTRAAAAFGATFEFLTPEAFSTFPLPTYAEIPVAIPNFWEVARSIDAAGADHVHIATEGPIGWTARHYCLERGRLFTTGFHTRFPEYVRARVGIPEDWTYNVLRHFHAPSAAVMAPTPSICDDLTRRGFSSVRVWTRGVDHVAFRPRAVADAGSGLDLPRPIFLYVGRIAVEKNLEALLALDLPGSTVLVGEGPARERLARRYPHAHFLGARFGEALAETYASADVFVFPSLTDTFGVVLLEALASGLPVAAFPAPGPLDVIGDSGAGVLSEDLREACLAALDIPREAARARALAFSWAESARQFLGHIEEQREARLSRIA